MAAHLLVTQVPAVEWDCFLWNLPKPLALRLGSDGWPDRDGAAVGTRENSPRRGGRYPRVGLVGHMARVRHRATGQCRHDAGANNRVRPRGRRLSRRRSGLRGA